MSEQSLGIKLNIKKKKKCCVKYCNSGVLEDPSIHYHQLPRPEKNDFVKHVNYFGKSEAITRLKAWQMALGIGNAYSKSMVVCSRHFNPENDYLFPNVPAEKRYLKRNAVPSLNLPKPLRSVETSRSRRLLKRQQQKAISVTKTSMPVEARSEYHQAVDSSIAQTVSEMDVTDYLEITMEPPSIAHSIPMETIQVPEEPKTRDFGCTCQPSSTEIGVETDKFTVVSFIKTDSELSTMTGLQSFEILHTIAEIIEKSFDKKEFEKSGLNLQGKLILTYMKLKQNMSYSALAILFQMSAKNCSRIFLKTMAMLKKVMKTLINWQSRETISRNLPLCFKGYEDVRVVLDCTEVHIEHTKCLGCQISTFSQYKGGLTAKFMTGVSPSGTIMYVSRMYGGKASDTAIFNQSDLFHLLEHGDAVMVDKGFLIESICEKNGWKLYRPAYLKDKIQFSSEETHKSCEEACARVHMERPNQRLKVFQILSSVVPCELLPILEDIFFVICGTVNLSSPIIADENFMKNPVPNINQCTEMGVG